MKTNAEEVLKEMKIIEKELEILSKRKLYIFIDEEKTYPKENIEENIKVEVIAMLMEYGSEEFNVPFPARPFFSSAIEGNLNHFKRIYEDGVKEIIEGKISSENLLKKLGKEVVDKVEESIQYGEFTPLSPLTIKRKDSAKPLMNTKLLLASIRYKII